MDGRPEGRVAAIIHNLLITQKITAMKKQLLFALVAFAALSLNACSKDDSNGDESWKDEPREDVFIEFKDRNFFAALMAAGVDTNKDGRISEKEASVVTNLSIVYGDICYMDEIRYFRALVQLSCSDNELTSLDVSNLPELETLSCGYNQLASLDVSHNLKLKRLNCVGNQLISLDISNNPTLETLDCSYNQLASLNVSKCPVLSDLNCSDNQLTFLDVSKCKWLYFLVCEHNSLKEIRIYKDHIIQQGLIDLIIFEYGDIITYVE